MSEPFETAGQGSPFTDRRPPLEDIFTARPAPPSRAECKAEPKRRRKAAGQTNAASSDQPTLSKGPRVPGFRALRGVAGRRRSDVPTADRRDRAGPVRVGVGFGRRLPPAYGLIAGALLLAAIASLGLVVGRESLQRENAHPEPLPPGRDLNPPRREGSAAGALRERRPSYNPAPARRRTTKRSSGRRSGRPKPPRARSRPLPAPPESVPSGPAPEGVAPPRAPGRQRSAPPGRQAPALPAPVPPGSPPEFL